MGQLIYYSKVKDELSSKQSLVFVKGSSETVKYTRQETYLICDWWNIANNDPAVLVVFLARCLV